MRAHRLSARSPALLSAAIVGSGEVKTTVMLSLDSNSAAAVSGLNSGFSERSNARDISISSTSQRREKALKKSWISHEKVIKVKADQCTSLVEHTSSSTAGTDRGRSAGTRREARMPKLSECLPALR